MPRFISVSLSICLTSWLLIVMGCGPKTNDASKKPQGSDAATPAADTDEPAAPEDTSSKTAVPEDATSKDATPKDASSKDAEPEDVAAQPPGKDEPPAQAPAPSSTVTLGDPTLTAGIPGEGPLTAEQVKAWLETPGIHDELDVALPPNVAWGTPQGLDDNPLTRAKIELGRQLYFDTRLSSDNTISCASCHHPDHDYAFNTRFGVGVEGQEGGRNSPVAFNRLFSGEQFWDGRAESLEEQAIGPIANPIEMGNTHEVAAKTVDDIPAYQMQFQAIFPDSGVTIENIGMALASFERVLITSASPYDYYEPLRAFEKQFADDLEDMESFKEDEPRLHARYLSLKKQSEEHPISEAAKRGRDLFFGKAKCTECHAGANFTDEKYHNLGVGMDAEDPDLGRYEVTQEETDKGAFKTPTCRNVTETGPYMHDGSLKTLKEVVDWYNKGGHPNPTLSKKIVKLNLTEEEVQDVVAFMEALTSDLPQVEQERLP